MIGGRTTDWQLLVRTILRLGRPVGTEPLVKSGSQNVALFVYEPRPDGGLTEPSRTTGSGTVIF
jgi:hypothetical protein